MLWSANLITALVGRTVISDIALSRVIRISARPRPGCSSADGLSVWNGRTAIALTWGSVERDGPRKTITAIAARTSAAATPIARMSQRFRTERIGLMIKGGVEEVRGAVSSGVTTSVSVVTSSLMIRVEV